MQTFAALQIGGRPRPVRCFKEGGSSVRGPPVRRVRVKFSLPCQTRFGESIGLVSSATGWDPRLPMKLEWSEGSVWRGEVELPAGEVVEYKYVLLSDQNGSVTWQPGSNLVLRLKEEGAQALRVRDDWLGASHEVEAEGAALPAMPEAAAAEEKEAAAAERQEEEEEERVEKAQSVMPTVAATVEPAHQPALQATAVVAPAGHASPPRAMPTAGESWREGLAVASQPVVPAAAAAATEGEEVAAAAAAEHVGEADGEAKWEGSEEQRGCVAGGDPAAAAGERLHLHVAEDEPEPQQEPEAESAPVESAPVATAVAESAPAETAAAASWRDALAVANQPYVPPHEGAAAPKAQAGAADAAPTEVAVAAPRKGPSSIAVAPPAATSPAPAPHQAAPTTTQAGPAMLATQHAAEPTAAVAAPAEGSLQRALRALAPLFRLLLAAAVVLSALAAFMRSLWAVARFAASAL